MHHHGPGYLTGPGWEHGLSVLRRVDGNAGEEVVTSLAQTAPRLAHDVVAHGFGSVYDRPGLSDRERQLVTLGVLTALGGCEAQLRVHVRASLNVGLSPDSVVTVMEHAAVYCGFPRALNAVGVVREVLGEDRDRPNQGGVQHVSTAGVQDQGVTAQEGGTSPASQAAATSMSASASSSATRVPQAG